MMAKFGTEILLVDFSDEFKSGSPLPTFKFTSFQGHLSWPEFIDSSGLLVDSQLHVHEQFVPVTKKTRMCTHIFAKVKMHWC